jgi:hypothetical protein
VKSSIVLTAVLSLAAVLLFSSQGSAQVTAPTIVRGSPVQVTIKTTPRRERFRPYTFTTRGRIIPPPRYCTPGQNPGPPGPNNCIPVICPPGVTDPRYCLFPGRGVICSGVVTVRVQKRGTTISSRNVGVRRDCTYRSKVTFHTLLRTRIGNLSFRARFQGNPVLLPRNSRTVHARAG